MAGGEVVDMFNDLAEQTRVTYSDGQMMDVRVTQRRKEEGM